MAPFANCSSLFFIWTPHQRSPNDANWSAHKGSNCAALDLVKDKNRGLHVEKNICEFHVFFH
jgi:hypothetical protein